MDKITLQVPYKLSELIATVAKAIIANGVDNALNFDDMNFCLYTKDEVEAVSAELTCYAERYPTINDEDEEMYPDFVTGEGLELFYTGENLESVILSLLSQKSKPSMNEFVAGLNYYMKFDSFLTL